MQRLCTTKSEICETEQKTALSLVWFMKKSALPLLALDYERKLPCDQSGLQKKSARCHLLDYARRHPRLPRGKSVPTVFRWVQLWKTVNIKSFCKPVPGKLKIGLQCCFLLLQLGGAVEQRRHIRGRDSAEHLSRGTVSRETLLRLESEEQTLLST